MELKGNQIAALASKLYQEISTSIQQKNNVVNEKIQKLVESKLNLKANKILKELIEYSSGSKYNINIFIQNKYKSEFDSIRNNAIKSAPSLQMIRDEIIISTIDTKDVKEIIDSIKKKFS